MENLMIIKLICFSYLLDKYGKEQLDEIIKE